jgi:hypothetical protein
MGENSYMRGQYIRSAWAKKHSDHAHARPTLCHGVACLFLTALLSYDAVALPLGQCEKLLRYGKLATSSFIRSLKRKGFKEEIVIKIGLYDLVTSTTLESNKSLL